jgi:hypothetical protein
MNELDIYTFTTISFKGVEEGIENGIQKNLKFFRINLQDDFRNKEVGEAFYLPVVNSADYINEYQNPDENMFVSNFYVFQNASIKDAEIEARRRFVNIQYASWDEFYDEISKIFFHDIND